jgi:hypothetical protein
MRRHKSTASSVSAGYVALNPIAPCGACNEWLRKIAEVNPDFKVGFFGEGRGAVRVVQVSVGGP